jgi:hypothetical protein
MKKGPMKNQHGAFFINGKGGYSPLNTGSRFWKNAVIPSMAS